MRQPRPSSRPVAVENLFRRPNRDICRRLRNADPQVTTYHPTTARERERRKKTSTTPPPAHDGFCGGSYHVGPIKFMAHPLSVRESLPLNTGTVRMIYTAGDDAAALDANVIIIIIVERQNGVENRFE